MVSISQMAIVSIFSHLMFIYFAWRILQAVDIERFMKRGRIREIQLFMIFLAIVIGSGVSRFFLEIIRFSQDLAYLL